MAARTATYSLEYTLALGFEGVDGSLGDFLAKAVVLLNHQFGRIEVVRQLGTRQHFSQPVQLRQQIQRLPRELLDHLHRSAHINRSLQMGHNNSGWIRLNKRKKKHWNRSTPSTNAHHVTVTKVRFFHSKLISR